MLSGLVSHAVVTAVAHGQCDLGFAEASLEHAAVLKEDMPVAPMVAVLPQAHRLARKALLRPADFAGESFISLGHTTLSRFRIDRVFAEHGVTRVMRIETPLSEISCSLAGAGAGVTLCEPFTATEYATRGIVARPFEPRIDFEFAALTVAQRSVPPVARAFIDAFRTHVADFVRRESWRRPPGESARRKGSRVWRVATRAPS